MNIPVGRFLDSNEGVFGMLQVGPGAGALILFTVERQWADNAVGKSCIPAGTYKLIPHHSPHLNIDTYEIDGVPGRDAVLIHPANTEEDLLGCIGVGLSLGVVEVKADLESGMPAKKLAVTQSQAAFKKFIAAVGGTQRTDLTVTVSWVNPDSKPKDD